jgi:hypothetical protein
MNTRYYNIEKILQNKLSFKMGILTSNIQTQNVTTTSFLDNLVAELHLS